MGVQPHDDAPKTGNTQKSHAAYEQPANFTRYTTHPGAPSLNSPEGYFHARGGLIMANQS
jgi:hypothetical protein